MSPKQQSAGRTQSQSGRLPCIVHGDAGEEQHDLAALSHDRCGDRNAEHQHRLRPLSHRIPEIAQTRVHLAGMLRHPDHVPGEHDDGQKQNAGDEDLLTAALEGM
jgi:hypothetical protein